MDDNEELLIVHDKVMEYCAQKMMGRPFNGLSSTMQADIRYRVREYVPLILRALKEIQDGQDRVEADRQ